MSFEAIMKAKQLELPSIQSDMSNNRLYLH
jgi:hypothetical protein